MPLFHISSRICPLAVSAHRERQVTSPRNHSNIRPSPARTRTTASVLKQQPSYCLTHSVLTQAWANCGSAVFEGVNKCAPQSLGLQAHSRIDGTSRVETVETPAFVGILTCTSSPAQPITHRLRPRPVLKGVSSMRPAACHRDHGRGAGTCGAGGRACRSRDVLKE